jgi:hypothetical protein
MTQKDAEQLLLEAGKEKPTTTHKLAEALLAMPDAPIDNEQHEDNYPAVDTIIWSDDLISFVRVGIYRGG